MSNRLLPYAYLFHTFLTRHNIISVKQYAGENMNIILNTYANVAISCKFSNVVICVKSCCFNRHVRYIIIIVINGVIIAF